MISKTISIDILKYLQEKENLSVDAITAAMDTNVNHIKQIITHKTQFTSKNLDAYLKFSGLHFWEFALKAIPLDHLPPKAKNRVLLCKDIAANIKKKNNKK